MAIELEIAEQIENWKREGKLFFYNRGITTTVVSFTNTAILLTRPSLVLRVPTNKTVIPMYLACHFQTAAGTLNEGIWVSYSNDLGAGTSTRVEPGTARGNMNTHFAGSSGGSVLHTIYSGDITTTGQNDCEFARWTQPFVDAITAVPKHDWIVDRKTQSNMPIIKGGGSMALIVGGGTALTGFATIVYAEVNSTDLGY